MNDIFAIAYQWAKDDPPRKIDEKYYCETRDIFQSRLDSMVNLLLKNSKIAENDIYILSAIAGEIGNNSFDHNLGTVVLADRGRGILATLKRVKPELKNDEEALKTAFNEKISGRAPESRGNGLKFVKESIKQTKNHLTFISGTAKTELNEKMEISQAEKINGCLALISN